MNRTRASDRGIRGVTAAIGGLVAIVIGSAATGSVAATAPESDLFDPKRPPAAELEMSAAPGFTLAAVGDCIISRPLSHKRAVDPAFARVVEILERADAAFGNLETSILDIRTFAGHPHSGAGDWGLTSLPAVAPDLAAMGFDLLSRANNHALDWGIEGMRETTRRLDEAGIVHAGTGEDRAAARAARYLETPKGRVGLVSIASTYGALAEALPPAGESPGRPGLSALRVERVTIVPKTIMASLREIDRAMRDAQPICRDDEEAMPDAESSAPEKGKPAPVEGKPAPDEITLFGTRFRAGERFAYAYEMNRIDRAEILKSVRLGKQHSDFLVVSIHAHQPEFDCSSPGGFVPVLARAAIDAGADAIITHGIHRLGPVAVYRGRPVFYGLANFFWSDIQEPLAPDLHEAYGDLLDRAFDDPDYATDADLTALLNARGFDDERVFETIVAVSRFDGGRLAEIRLHPVDLGYGLRLTESGVPRLAGPDAARRILTRLQDLSKPYGTTISIEKGVGVIRPRAD